MTQKPTTTNNLAHVPPHVARWEQRARKLEQASERQAWAGHKHMSYMYQKLAAAARKLSWTDLGRPG